VLVARFKVCASLQKQVRTLLPLRAHAEHQQRVAVVVACVDISTAAVVAAVNTAPTTTTSTAAAAAVASQVSPRPLQLPQIFTFDGAKGVESPRPGLATPRLSRHPLPVPVTMHRAAQNLGMMGVMLVMVVMVMVAMAVVMGLWSSGCQQ
jgi:hypothetical protein